jgi:DNA primase
MAKVSPVSIKYMIRGNFSAEGALEKPDVIGALFGQTEGLLGADLEMRELQKEGKIGRIEVELERDGKRTIGKIQIPTALDQSETTLIAAAIETIERIGPSEAQIEIERIEDVRGTKRDYIIERAKKLMKQIEGKTDSREISNTIKDSARTSQIQEYGDEKLPSGDLAGREVIVVEGRADVVNLLRNNVNNVIAMNGTKLPQAVRELSREKEITLFVDGDRGGKLIVQNVMDNADVDYIAMAPDGKEVEELTGKEIWISLRKKVPKEQYQSRNMNSGNGYRREYEARKPEKEKTDVGDYREKLKKLSEENSGTGKAIILDENLEEIKKVSEKSVSSTLNRMRNRPFAIVIDGTATPAIIRAAEEVQCKIIVAKNFSSTSSSIELLSL